MADAPESEVTKAIRLHAAQQGAMLWRNNVGAAQDANGNFFRYGLANDNPQMGRKIKSSDLIGIRPVVITQDMVGKTLGQFVAIEAKRGGWHYTGTPREQAQQKFLDIVNSMGGYGVFAAGPVDLILTPASK